MALTPSDVICVDLIVHPQSLSSNSVPGAHSISTQCPLSIHCLYRYGFPNKGFLSQVPAKVENDLYIIHFGKIQSYIWNTGMFRRLLCILSLIKVTYTKKMLRIQTTKGPNKKYKQTDNYIKNSNQKKG